MSNRQVILAQRPVGMVDEHTTQVIESPQPVCGANEALIKVGVVSIDPTIRTWMNDAPGYMAPIALGGVVRSGGVGEVVQSRSDDYQVGDIVYGVTGWQEWAIASDANKFQVIPTGLGLDIPVVMGALGMTGLTAYFGLLDVGQFKPGDVVVVSGAGGATGSVVGQGARCQEGGRHSGRRPEVRGNR
jgi:NADPH-dependent curcumin reductase